MNENPNYSMLSVERDPKFDYTKTLDKIRSFFKRPSGADAPDDHLFSQKGMDLVRSPRKFPPNVVRSQRYNAFSFVPMVVFDQFRVFYNFYYLLISCAYLYPPLRLGVWWTCWVPIVFFLFAALFKEGFEDRQRKKRDNTINNSLYTKLCPNGRGEQQIARKEICPGDFILLKAGQTVPADMILMSTDSQHNGSVFVKTDQFDGETDWKMRRSVSLLAKLSAEDVSDLEFYDIRVDAPSKDISAFGGSLRWRGKAEKLGLENTVWADTALAAGNAVGFVLYTGAETKAAMNTAKPPFKLSLLESEANYFAKLLFALQIFAAVLLAVSLGVNSGTFLNVAKFVLLLSYILPVSLRVNLDMGKSYYSYKITHDEEIKTTKIRNPNVCEELGRISYLLTDKTGTLTLNQMSFKKLKSDGVTYTKEIISKICKDGSKLKENATMVKMLEAMSLCHNVSPTEEDASAFQGSSSDEIALVQFAKENNFQLLQRDSDSLSVQWPANCPESAETPSAKINFKILRHLPFRADLKRMGILLQRENSEDALFLCKGAEEAVIPLLAETHRRGAALEEEARSLALEGLRTLVFSAKTLSKEQLERFESAFDGAKTEAARREAITSHLESDLQPIGVTGVEDELRGGVKSTFETLRQAGIRVWMVTGDKAETAVCVGKATGMVCRQTTAVNLGGDGDDLAAELLIAQNAAKQNEKSTVLIVTGDVLTRCLEKNSKEFAALATTLSGVIICRSSPTQKADVVRLVQNSTKTRVCAVGDGGNDVGMISVADVGVGIEGREGQSASLAADVSVGEFRSLSKLLLWHGRNSYLRSSSLAQLIFHRGVIIAVMQILYTVLLGVGASPLFTGWLVIGYTTVYTSIPVFSLVLDQDISYKDMMIFPQFYDYLQKDGHFSHRVFCEWLLKSAFQGAAIMLVTFAFNQKEFDFNAITVAFTALILSELFNITFEIKTWNIFIAAALFVSTLIYVISVLVLPNIFDEKFVHSQGFVLHSLLATSASVAPVVAFEFFRRKISPRPHQKISFDN